MEDRDPLVGSDKKYIILTYGCQMNERDSEVIAGLLESSGYRCADSLDDTDLVVFNTCSVRHSAENKVYGKLGEIKKLKTEKRHLKVAFGGCMAQLEDVRKRLGNLGVDLVFGTHNVHELPEMLEQMYERRKRYVRVWDKPGEVVEGLPSIRNIGLTAFVNIMYGCNNYCAYCIVPYVRGQERSREPDQIVAEIQQLVDKGVKEVTLLGQNVNSYGKGLAQEIDFSDLLAKVNSIEGLLRVRFMTSHPRDFNDKLIDTVSSLDKVCEHIHIPMQAGSNKILKMMNRGYTREQYFALIDRIRDRVSGSAITTDLIVGFPGEEEVDFNHTIEAVDRIRFDGAFTFIYSKRTGTRACDMENHVPLDEKRRRLMLLNDIQYRIARESNDRYLNEVVEILVEGPSKNNQTKLTGRTRTNRIVVFDGPDDLIGQMTKIRITESGTFTLFGEKL
ncbi:MAG: tRNA (N6-isopentenyl adenosine(37)-C2)-methylthiotransferase MiaB [Ignavibacteriales bacterium]